jgi:hypothetical protein
MGVGRNWAGWGSSVAELYVRAAFVSFCSRFSEGRCETFSAVEGKSFFRA